jgi:hypothetical protein
VHRWLVLGCIGALVFGLGALVVGYLVFGCSGVWLFWLGCCSVSPAKLLVCLTGSLF